MHNKTLIHVCHHIVSSRMSSKYLTGHLRFRTLHTTYTYIRSLQKSVTISPHLSGFSRADVKNARQFASRVIVKESPARTIFRAIRNLFVKPKMKTPPYDHICQVGDPILRGQSSLVDPRHIKSADLQNIITMMTSVMRRVGAIGGAAPQVGVAKQIIVMEFTEKHKHRFEKEVLKAREVEVFPRKVFINPVVKVTDHRVVMLLEGCLSVGGYDACVPRAYGVQITGFNERGEEVTWKATGYSARIIQHEVDHLQGRLFIDTMDPSTFLDKEWPRWNLK